MYFQNALMTIEVCKNNEINYAMLTKFLLRSQLLVQQQPSEPRLGSSSANTTTTNTTDSDAGDSSQAIQEENLLINDFPQNQSELAQYKASVIEKM